MGYNGEVTGLLTVDAIEPSALTEPQWRALHRLRMTLDLEELPDDQPVAFEEMQGEMLVTRPSSRTHHLLARDGEVVVGHAWVGVDLKDNLHLAWSWIAVDPERRRQGIGRRLLGGVVEVAAAEDRSSLGLDVRHGTEGMEFAPAFGFEEKLIEHHNRTTVDRVDDAMIQDWIDRAAERAPDYTLRFWVDATPEDCLDDFARVFNVMNTAPRDDLDMEDFAMTPDLEREREATLAPRGVTRWTLVAVAPDGRFAGFTELFFSKWRTDVCHQGNTGVDPAHRDRGLGRWLKAAMYQRLRADRPSFTKIDTWNAGSNAPMLAINHAMGFAPIHVWSSVQADLATVRSQLARQSG